MSAIFPLAVWQPGTLQPSTPFNDNALRVEILQRGAISILSTPPGSPADGDVHILGSSPTGAWSTFAQNDVVLWRSGTWYRFAPFTGWLKQVGSDIRRFDGSAWVVVAVGGAAVPVQDEGTTVVATPTAINFVGTGVTVTNSGGVATVTIPGGAAGGAIDPGIQSWGYIAANVAGSGFSNIGALAIATTGSAAARTVSGASLVDSLPRSATTATASATAVCGFQANAALIFCLGGSAGIGGFNVKHRVIVGNGANIASHRFFSGFGATTVAPTDVDPSTLLNIIGIGYDSADTQLQIMHNDASGTATKVALGASFPKPTTALTAVYDVEWSTDPGSGVVSYTVVDVTSGATATGSINTNLPAGATMLTLRDYMSAGGTSTALSLEACWWYYRLGKPRP